MKTSNKLLVVFIGFVILMMAFTASQLKAEYKKINLNDKFRNHDRIAVKSVRFLVIQGSVSNLTNEINKFPVNCIPGNNSLLLLPRDRFLREHITYKQSGDTLIISSTLPFSSDSEVFLSGINPEKIEANAGRILLDRLDIDQLQMALEGNADLTIANTQIKDFTVKATDESKVKLLTNSAVDNLNINLQKQSEIELGDAKLNKVSLQMSSSAKIATTKENLLLLQKSSSLQ